jgi:predicted nucleotidyltransferase/uncharacterized protein (UPF0332 family)
MEKDILKKTQDFLKHKNKPKKEKKHKHISKEHPHKKKKVKSVEEKKETQKIELEQNPQTKIIEKIIVKKIPEKDLTKKISKIESLSLSKERDIAMDFATKVYSSFNQMIKAVILFGSSAKKLATPDSDIDIIVLIDDVSIKWDNQLITWYREELGKIIQKNPYEKSLHINTVKLTTWWQDMIRGDPVIINVLRNGEALIDFGGFFTPLQILLKTGQIKSTPEAIYTLLERAPTHLMRTKASLLTAVDGLYWAMVDSAHAALISANIQPPSPEEIPQILKTQFVDTKLLHPAYIDHYVNLHNLAKSIIHGKQTEVKGQNIDNLIKVVDAFIGEMARIIKLFIDKK